METLMTTKIRMLRPRTWRDAGAERQLNIGETYDLPTVVAQALIATGAAERAENAESVEESSPRDPHVTPRRFKAGRSGRHPSL